MWGVPVDHEYFKNTNMVQWMWYYHNDLKDKEENYIRNRNLIEYHARFINPEDVEYVIEQRESKSDNVIGTRDDRAFTESIGKIFGRTPSLPTTSDDDPRDVHEVDSLLDRIEQYEQEQALINREKTPYNYRHWSDFDLEK